MTPPVRRSPLVPAAAVGGLVAVAAFVLALIRPWGDVGVAADGRFDDGRPVAPVVVLGLAAVVALAAAVLADRADRGPAGRRRAVVAGVVAVLLGALDLLLVLAVTLTQAFPRDGGWWALVGAGAAALTGVLVVAAGRVRPVARRARLATLTLAVALPVALAVAGVVVAPGWSGHVVDATHPATFSESPGPATVTRVGWRQDFGEGAVSAVLGGRVVVATDRDSGDGCRLQIRALDAGTGRVIWSVARTLRCDGPRLAALDGDTTVVRVTLRGTPTGGGRLTGPAVTLHYGTEDGRAFTPSSDLDAVQWWSEGFGLVTAAGTVRGLDPRTGVTTWSRDLPRCDDGSAATLQLPDAPAAGAVVARSPYDGLGALPGTQHVAGVGRDVVLALRCGATPRVWIVDALGAATDDELVTLPVSATVAGDAGAMTFLPWVDAVVAVVPTAAPTGTLHPATVFGVGLTAGAVTWIRPSLQLTTADLSPVDGSVRLSGLDPDRQPQAVDLDIADGTVLATGDTAPQASVALTGARLGIDGRAVTVVGSAADDRVLDLPDCTPDTTSGAATVLAGPGGVVVRCVGPNGFGSAAVGLVP